MKTLDLRPRCAYCNKIPRGKAALADFKKYEGHCSYDHQQRAHLQAAMRTAGISTFPFPIRSGPGMEP
jgi:hypothetical protein